MRWLAESLTDMGVGAGAAIGTGEEGEEREAEEGGALVGMDAKGVEVGSDMETTGTIWFQSEMHTTNSVVCQSAQSSISLALSHCHPHKNTGSSMIVPLQRLPWAAVKLLPEPLIPTIFEQQRPRPRIWPGALICPGAGARSHRRTPAPQLAGMARTRHRLPRVHPWEARVEGRWHCFQATNKLVHVGQCVRFREPSASVWKTELSS